MLNFFGKLAFCLAEEVIGEVVVPPNKKLEDLIRLSELCVDLLRQNEEFYAEVGRERSEAHFPIIATGCGENNFAGRLQLKTVSKVILAHSAPIFH